MTYRKVMSAFLSLTMVCIGCSIYAEELPVDQQIEIPNSQEVVTGELSDDVNMETDNELTENKQLASSNSDDLENEQNSKAEIIDDHQTESSNELDSMLDDQTEQAVNVSDDLQDQNLSVMAQLSLGVGESEESVEAVPADTSEAGKEIQIKIPRTGYSFTGDYLSHVAALTASNPQNSYTFNITSPRMIVFGAAATNTNLAVHLCSLDVSTGTATILGSAPAGTMSYLQNAVAGDYAFLVLPKNGTVSTDTTYQIFMNSRAKGNSKNSILKVSNYLNWVLYKVDTWPEEYYVDNYFICKGDMEMNDHLDFTYSDDTVWYGREDWYRVNGVKVLNISTPITYSSKVASSNNAIAIDCAPGTWFAYDRMNDQYDSHGNVIGIIASHIDFNRTLYTPRAFDSVDCTTNGPQTLVYDYKLGRVIDFVGSQSFFYATKIYPLPTTSYIE